MLKITVRVAQDTADLLRAAARREQISLSRFLLEAGVERAARATGRDIETRIERLEQAVFGE